MRRNPARVHPRATVDCSFSLGSFVHHDRLLLSGCLHGRVSLPNIICNNSGWVTLLPPTENMSRGREHDLKLRTERARSVRFFLVVFHFGMHNCTHPRTSQRTGLYTFSRLPNWRFRRPNNKCHVKDVRTQEVKGFGWYSCWQPVAPDFYANLTGNFAQQDSHTAQVFELLREPTF
jgi:hypothetical protein